MQPSETIRSNSKAITILIHVGVWAALWTVLFVYQPLSWGIAVPYQFWIKQGIVLVMVVGTYYTNANILVPRFLLKDRFRDYFLLLILLAGVVMLINYFVDPLLRIPKLMEEAFNHRAPRKHGGGGRHHEFDLIMLFIVALVLGISTSITAIQKWQRDQRVKQDLEQEKTASELSFLKAQINPHFFFNTLNNIYALTVVDVERSREAIHKLSRMMRYLLYETQQDTTLLSKEIGFIKDYIDLMQLRLTDKVNLKFETPVMLNDMQIAPMLFLPFVENALKHGVSATQNSHITIAIQQSDTTLTMDVANDVFEDLNQGMEAGSGIGLVNTRRRLELLYADKYTLEIKNDAATYQIHLQINLA